ncbi:MAG: 4Fe-4S dicluster domain-containing protein [Elusimicrobia bacterium]|nr:4Fe-4S dicluster domain-containing protein [Elusimicrobiota bacterium]
MKYPKLRELKEAIKALIKGPYTTKFPFEPHTPFPRFRGKPVPDEKGCIGCGACAEVCPPRSIEIKDSSGGIAIPQNLSHSDRRKSLWDNATATRTIRWRHDFCIFCGQCERLCTTRLNAEGGQAKEGVKLSAEFDLADLKRDNMFSEIKKELVVCSQCSEIIAPKDQILYVAKKLGAQAYSNINIIALTQQELLDNSADALLINDPSQLLRRQTAFKILCPKCRHQVFVFDDYGK